MDRIPQHGHQPNYSMWVEMIRFYSRSHFTFPSESILNVKTRELRYAEW